MSVPVYPTGDQLTFILENHFGWFEDQSTGDGRIRSIDLIFSHKQYAIEEVSRTWLAADICPIPFCLQDFKPVGLILIDSNPNSYQRRHQGIAPWIQANMLAPSIKNWEHAIILEDSHTAVRYDYYVAYMFNSVELMLEFKLRFYEYT